MIHDTSECRGKHPRPTNTCEHTQHIASGVRSLHCTVPTRPQCSPLRLCRNFISNTELGLLELLLLAAWRWGCFRGLVFGRRGEVVLTDELGQEVFLLSCIAIVAAQ
eukprot:15440522-Alexandrium_andersonii.AAC.1